MPGAGTGGVPSQTTGGQNGGATPNPVGGQAGSGAPAVNGGQAGGGGQAGSGGGAPVNTGPISGHVYVIEYPGKLMEISAAGQVVWEYQTPSLAVMFQVLDSGNVFFPHAGSPTGAMEVDRAKNVVWSFQSQAQEVLGGERLANGNTLLGEQGPAVALEIDQAKAVVRSVPIATTTTEAHRQIRHIKRLQNGNVLAALEGENAVREYSPTGATVWDYTGIESAHDAVRLENGNTLIGGGVSKRVVEVTPAGQVAWEFNANDGPELGLAWITNVQVLRSGNILVCNWVGSGGGAGVHAFEVTRAKEVVWKLDDHTLIKSATMVLAVDD